MSEAVFQGLRRGMAYPVGSLRYVFAFLNGCMPTQRQSQSQLLDRLLAEQNIMVARTFEALMW
jgi:hypothetical protein